MRSIRIPETFRKRPYPTERFSQIVSWASTKHPFYQKFGPGPDGEVPLVTRDQITDNNELLLNGHTETGRTSGSTGVPVRIAWPPEKSRRESESYNIFRQWVGPKLPLAKIISLRELESQSGGMDICKPLDEQLEFLGQFESRFDRFALLTFPSNAVNLAGYLCDQGKTLPRLERLVCYAESFDEEHTPLLQQAFPQARIWDNYSCSEVGIMALKCPHDTGYHHIMGHSLGIEVLDGNNLPCREGETGRIIVTDWFNTFTPFIRYELGDLAIAGSCPCGEIGYPSVRTVLGKVRGFLKDSDGNPRIFANIGAELKMVESLRQYQIIQEDMDSLRVRYVASPGANEKVMKQVIQEKIWNFIGFEPVLHFEKEDTIERESNGKFYATLCRI